MVILGQKVISRQCLSPSTSFCNSLTYTHLEYKERCVRPEFIFSENFSYLLDPRLCVLLQENGSSRREAVPFWLSLGFRLGNETQIPRLLRPACPQVWRR